MIFIIWLRDILRHLRSIQDMTERYTERTGILSLIEDVCMAGRRGYTVLIRENVFTAQTAGVRMT